MEGNGRVGSGSTGERKLYWRNCREDIKFRLAIWLIYVRLPFERSVALSDKLPRPHRCHGTNKCQLHTSCRIRDKEDKERCLSCHPWGFICVANPWLMPLCEPCKPCHAGGGVEASGNKPDLPSVAYLGRARQPTPISGQIPSTSRWVRGLKIKTKHSSTRHRPSV